MEIKKEITEITLESGMSGILKENHSSSVVSLQVFIKAGSMHEGEYEGSGISHFIEHVIDDGTTNRSRAEIDRLTESIGNESNAYTWKDHTKYYITTASAYFDLALDLLADCLQNATFPEGEVEIQRGVIINEFNKEADEPESKLQNLFYETAFQVHPVRLPVIGYVDRFCELRRADLIKFYKRVYVPENLIFVAVGDFETAKVLDKIQRAFENFKPTNSQTPQLPPEPIQDEFRQVQAESEVEFAYTWFGLHTVAISHEDIYALDIMASILSEGESSRLYRTIKDEKDLVLSIDAWSDTSPYMGYFGIGAETEPEKLEAAHDAILKEIEKLKVEPVSKAEISKAIVLRESEHIFAQQTVEVQASALGLDQLATGDFSFSDKYLRKIKSVTAENIMKVALKYFSYNNLTIASLIPR